MVSPMWKEALGALGRDAPHGPPGEGEVPPAPMGNRTAELLTRLKTPECVRKALPVDPA